MRSQSFQKDATRPNNSKTISPRVFMGGIRSAYAGPGLKLSPHKMVVSTIVIGLEKPFRIEFFDSKLQNVSVTRVGLIPPDTLHHLETRGSMLFLYLDPLSNDYRNIDIKLIRDQSSYQISTIRRSIEDYSPSSLPHEFLDGLCELAGISIVKNCDQRITGVLNEMDKRPDEFTNVEYAAEVAQLSVSRFQHLFRESVGTTFRRYRIWKRMRVVAVSLSEKKSLTEAAYRSGFSSSAHLSAAFKDMFGVSPSTLLEVGTEIFAN